MALHEKELIEALSSSRILSSMITPAVLISACGTLIFSTSARMGRIFDRVNVMKSEIEAIVSGKISYPDERMAHLKDQIALQRRRATLIHKAMLALYTATSLFVAASLAIAFNVAYGSPEQAWILLTTQPGLGVWLGHGVQANVKPGDTYAITCGEPMGYPGGTNMLKVCRVA